MKKYLDETLLPFVFLVMLVCGFGAAFSGLVQTQPESASETKNSLATARAAKMSSCMPDKIGRGRTADQTVPYEAPPKLWKFTHPEQDVQSWYNMNRDRFTRM